MSKSFKMEYNDNIYILPKDEVRFFYGYGIVKIRENCEINSPYLFGIVDGNYQEAFPLTSSLMMPKLAIVPNGTFLYQYYDMGINDYVVWHANSLEASINLEAHDLTRVEPYIFQLDFADGSALYDAINCTFLTPCYSAIGPFIDSPFYNGRVANASFIVVDSEENAIDEVSTIIKTNGELVAPYVSLKTGEVFISKNLEEVVNKITGVAR